MDNGRRVKITIHLQSFSSSPLFTPHFLFMLLLIGVGVGCNFPIVAQAIRLRQYSLPEDISSLPPVAAGSNSSQVTSLVQIPSHLLPSANSIHPLAGKRSANRTPPHERMQCSVLVGNIENLKNKPPAFLGFANVAWLLSFPGTEASSALQGKSVEKALAASLKLMVGASRAQADQKGGGTVWNYKSMIEQCAVNSEGHTILMALFRRPYLSVLEDREINRYIRTQDLSTLRDTNGKNMLHLTVESGVLRAVDMVLSSLQTLDIVNLMEEKDNLGNRPIDYAERNRSIDIVTKLKEKYLFYSTQKQMLLHLTQPSAPPSPSPAALAPPSPSSAAPAPPSPSSAAPAEAPTPTPSIDQPLSTSKDIPELYDHESLPELPPASAQRLFDAHITPATA